MRYCIWNNKGGVGKTFLTYCLSTEYAIKHPEKAVVIADMCPQANISEMLLGGNGIGEENLNACYENSRTIASYIKSRYDRSRFGKLGNETSYFVKAKDYNPTMPENLYLLPGDVDLDICSSIIDYLAAAPERGAWAKSRSFLDDLIGVFEADRKKDSTVFFIDSNPSFANYTQLGLIAANRIIIPCTADSASIRGIHNILRLVFGVKSGCLISNDDVFDTFHSKVRDIGGIEPKIHSFVLNKARTMNRRASQAYQAHVTNITTIASELSATHSACFTDPVRANRIYDMKDCNTLAPIINFNGLVPSLLRHQTYQVYGKNTKANQSQITPFLDDLEKLVSSID
ncbi:MAG: ParA family protein [Thermoguttaceae bacterium]